MFVQEELAPGLHEDGRFRFHIPATLSKSADGTTTIEGIASVETPDFFGETVLVQGMDLSYLLDRGYFNDNHDKTTGGKVGVPTEAKVVKEEGKNALYVKGYLFDTDRAQAIVETARALEKSNSSRQLGFSIEGKTIERNGKLISKCWVKDIAITAEPVNTYSYMNIVKSLSARMEKEGYVDTSGVEHEPPAVKEPGFWEKMDGLLDTRLKKALETGYDRPAAEGGGVLRNESVEDGLKYTDDVPPVEIEEPGKSWLLKAAAVELIMQRGHSKEVAAAMADVIFKDEARKLLLQF